MYEKDFSKFLIQDSDIKKYIDTKKEKKLTGKAGSLLIVNTGAFHKATDLKFNNTREVCWVYTTFPNFLSKLKKKIKAN